MRAGLALATLAAVVSEVYFGVRGTLELIVGSESGWMWIAFALALIAIALFMTALEFHGQREAAREEIAERDDEIAGQSEQIASLADECDRLRGELDEKRAELAARPQTIKLELDFADLQTLSPLLKRLERVTERQSEP